jgi:hypothetical protein
MLSTLARRFRPTQPWLVCSGSGNIGDLHYQCSTRAWPPASGQMHLTGGGIHGFKDGIHRFILDSETKQYFGYDALLESTERPAEYRLVFEPLSLKPDHLVSYILGIERRWAITPVERLPSPRILRLDHTIAFEFATADGKHKVSERIRFTKHPGSNLRRLLRSQI